MGESKNFYRAGGFPYFAGYSTIFGNIPKSGFNTVFGIISIFGIIDNIGNICYS